MKSFNAYFDALTLVFKRGVYFVPVLFISSVLFFLIPTSTQAATLYFSPNSGSYSVGQTFSVSILVSSTDQTMNAVSGSVSFPKELLQVTSLSKTSSVVSLWVQEPSFSNSDGTVNFEGIVLNPGFTGSSGKIITLNFKVRATGKAPLSFTTSSVLANDGKGTNILSTAGSANFVIGSASTEEAPTANPVLSNDDLPTPKISSSTHPDQNVWYSKRDAEFVWDAPDSVTKVKILYNKISMSEPTVAYEPPIMRKVVTDISDGVWYFHVRTESSSKRSNTAHFKFQVDTEKPDYFEVREVARTDKTEPEVKFIFDARDRTSGIDKFEIKTDDSLAQTWKYNSDTSYTTKALSPGKHTLSVKALDKAGNFAMASIDFEIEPLRAPIFTQIPKEIEKGDQLIVAGTSDYPGSKVVVMYQKDGEEKSAQETTVSVDESGNFNVTIPETEFSRGEYVIWGKALDKRGAQSLNSEKHKVTVVSAGLLKIGGILISYFTLFLSIFLLIIASIVSTMYAWYKITTLQRKIREEREVAVKGIEKAFTALRDEVKQQVTMLDNDKRISESERRIYEKLRSALKISEGFISKKVHNIGDENE